MMLLARELLLRTRSGRDATNPSCRQTAKRRCVCDEECCALLQGKQIYFSTVSGIYQIASNNIELGPHRPPFEKSMASIRNWPPQQQ